MEGKSRFASLSCSVCQVRGNGVAIRWRIGTSDQKTIYIFLAKNSLNYRIVKMEYDRLRSARSSPGMWILVVYVYFVRLLHMHATIQFLNQWWSSSLLDRWKNKPISRKRLKYLPVIRSKKFTNWTSLSPIKSSKTNISYSRTRKKLQSKIAYQSYYCIDLIEIRLTCNICITHFICQMSRWSNVYHSSIFVILLWSIDWICRCPISKGLFTIEENEL